MEGADSKERTSPNTALTATESRAQVTVWRGYCEALEVPHPVVRM